MSTGEMTTGVNGKGTTKSKLFPVRATISHLKIYPEQKWQTVSSQMENFRSIISKQQTYRGCILFFSLSSTQPFSAGVCMHDVYNISIYLSIFFISIYICVYTDRHLLIEFCLYGEGATTTTKEKEKNASRDTG